MEPMTFEERARPSERLADGTPTPVTLGRTVPPVSVRHVTKTYRLGALHVTALADVSLVVARGEFLAVAGPSGSGKTTLLNLIGCLDTPTSGDVEIDGEPVSRLSAGRRADLRARRLGFTFQGFNLIPVLTAWENVEYPLLICSAPATPTLP
jgi:putative ABC transport system ATP-binding protein